MSDGVPTGPGDAGHDRPGRSEDSAPEGEFLPPSGASGPRSSGAPWAQLGDGAAKPAPPGAIAPSGPGGWGVVPQRRVNGLAVAALAFGILWIWWAGSVAAVILGHVALRQVDASDGVQRGRGAALAGVVLGWIGVGSLAVYLVAVLASG